MSKQAGCGAGLPWAAWPWRGSSMPSKGRERNGVAPAPTEVPMGKESGRGCPGAPVHWRERREGWKQGAGCAGLCPGARGRSTIPSRGGLRPGEKAQSLGGVIPRAPEDPCPPGALRALGPRDRLRRHPLVLTSFKSREKAPERKAFLSSRSRWRAAWAHLQSLPRWLRWRSGRWPLPAAASLHQAF